MKFLAGLTGGLPIHFVRHSWPSFGTAIFQALFANPLPQGARQTSLAGGERTSNTI